MKAKFISITYVRGVKKYRVECPYCEERVSLNPKTKEHLCKKCKLVYQIKK